jgi:hypothetical protein
MMFSDTETDMLEGEPPSASCVQGSDDSRNSAIRIAYRTLLRSSSLWEPRYPSLKIFLVILNMVLSYLIDNIKGPYKKGEKGGRKIRKRGILLCLSFLPFSR